MSTITSGKASTWIFNTDFIDWFPASSTAYPFPTTKVYSPALSNAKVTLTFSLEILDTVISASGDTVTLSRKVVFSASSLVLIVISIDSPSLHLLVPSNTTTGAILSTGTSGVVGTTSGISESEGLLVSTLSCVVLVVVLLVVLLLFPI